MNIREFITKLEALADEYGDGTLITNIDGEPPSAHLDSLADSPEIVVD